MTSSSTGSRPSDRSRSLGAYGEAYAARHLVEGGMVVLDSNWRCEAGEIDLVLRDGRVLVVCEVKTRSSLAYGSPLEAVTEQKAARLRRLAARWLEEHAVRPDEVRIDLVGVLVPRSGGPRLEHVRGIG
ncbi:YraN family protein [soil metagenome]